jgi:hypothetical protein
VSTVVAEPQTTGAIVTLHDKDGIGGLFHRGADGIWIDEDGFEFVWAEVELLAATGGYGIDVVERAVTA